MNKLHIFIAVVCLFLISPLASTAAAGTGLSGILVPVSKERITILTGDKATVTLGEKDGVIKGDIGLVLSDRLTGSDRVIGECAITDSGYEASLCELIKGRQEVEKGNVITFEPLVYTDANLYPIAVSLLSQAVKPYEPYKRVNVCIYGIFDNQGSVTGLSERIRKEIESIFQQKKHIKVLDKKALDNLVFYPEDGKGEYLGFIYDHMQKANIDVLVTGSYTVSENKINLTLSKMDRNGHSVRLLYSFPSKDEYTTLASRAVMSRQPVTRMDRIESLIAVRPIASQIQKNEKNESIKYESAGNPFIEQTMRRIEFNIVNPVDIAIKVDDERVSLDRTLQQRVRLTEGSHRIAVSFKRGYYYNESLMYTSERVSTKEVLVDVHKVSNLVVEVLINPLSQDTIIFDAYESEANQRLVLKPIRKITSDHTVETFKD